MSPRQPVNQQTNKSINNAIGKSTTYSINKSINSTNHHIPKPAKFTQSTNQLITQSTNHQTKIIDQSINQYPTQPANASIYITYNQPIHQSTTHNPNTSANQPTNQSIHQSINLSTNHVHAQSIYQSINQSCAHSILNAMNS